MAINEYRDTKIKREGLEIKIEEFLNEKGLNANVTVVPTKMVGKEIFELILTDHTLKFDIFNKPKGLTFSFKQYGVSEEERTEHLYPMADWLLENHSFDKETKTFYIVEEFSEEDFNFIIDLLCDEGTYGCTRKNISNGGAGEIVKLEGKKRDEITLTYYNTRNKFMVQGVPREVYWYLIGILSEIDIPLEKRLEAINQSIKAPISLLQIKKNANKAFTFYSVLNEDLQRFITTYLALKESGINILEDYSPISFPALKLAEGVIRKILSDELDLQGLELNDKSIALSKNFKGNKKIFYLCETKNEYLIRTEISISCPKKKRNLEELYSFFNTHRHTTFHADEYGTSTIIETFEGAVFIGDLVLKKIENLLT